MPRPERKYLRQENLKGGKGAALVTITNLQKILQNPRIVLKQIGRLLVDQTQRAFRNQATPAGEKWKARYPNQDSQFLNVAGALSDFNSGRAEPKPIRFQNKPVLKNTGNLKNYWNAVTKENNQIEGKFKVVVGVTGKIAGYASRMQYGGESEMDITPEGKSRLYLYLYPDGKRGRKTAKRETVTARMGWMLNKYKKPTKLMTDVVPRTFLDIVPTTERKINTLVTKTIEKEMKSRG
tara:strand:- start:8818 stop:9528 length:711 start_codon:yes stop_codon:yes gene_type:complete